MTGPRTLRRWICALPSRILTRALSLALLLALAPLGALPAAAQSGPPVTGSAAASGGPAGRDRVFAAHGLVPPVRATARVDTGPGPGAAPTGEARGDASGVSADLAPKVAMSDVRLGLMQLALAFGPAGQSDIYAALPAMDAPAIYLREGRARMQDLADLSAAAGHPGAFRQTGDTYLALVPIIVLGGAELVLGAGESLVLSRGAGSFLLSFGGLSITGASILSSDARDGQDPDAFRPFVASLGSGGLRVIDSRFAGLGFGPSPVLSGLSVATAGLYGANAPALIADSAFTDLGGVSVIDSDRVTITGNTISDARHTALWIDGSEQALVSRNVVTGTRGSHALHLGGSGRGGMLRDNVLSGGANAGLRLDAGITDIEISGNLIEGFAGEGAAILDGARCIWLHRNLIRSNGGNALRAVASDDVIVDGNIVSDNRGMGLALTAGGQDSHTLVIGNAFAGNRAGIFAATPGHLRMAGNDISGQLPRLLAGDLAQHTALLLHTMAGGGSADLDIRRVSATPWAARPGADAGARAFAACRIMEGG